MTYLIENGDDCLNALFDHSDEGKNDSVNFKSAYTKLILVNVGQRIILLMKDKIRICGTNAHS